MKQKNGFQFHNFFSIRQKMDFNFTTYKEVDINYKNNNCFNITKKKSIQCVLTSPSPWKHILIPLQNNTSVIYAFSNVFYWTYLTSFTENEAAEELRLAITIIKCKIQFQICFLDQKKKYTFECFHFFFFSNSGTRREQMTYNTFSRLAMFPMFWSSVNSLLHPPTHRPPVSGGAVGTAQVRIKTAISNVEIKTTVKPPTRTHTNTH